MSLISELEMLITASYSRNWQMSKADEDAADVDEFEDEFDEDESEDADDDEE